MKYRKRQKIVEFYDVSILMPFYKRLDDFRKVLPKNAPFFKKNGVEILILLDHQEEEKELLQLIEQFPFINFKVIINRKEHEWRNPCKVLNVGIRNASFNYILVLDPEVELITDVIHKLRYTLSFYPFTYATGVVTFLDHEERLEEAKNPNWMPYGSIMTSRHDLITIRGYDEYHTEWGGEDDKIRRKLDLMGLKKMELLDAKTVHREAHCDGHEERSSRLEKMPIRHLKNILYPKKTIANGENWGRDFNECVWDWEENKSYPQMKKYLSKFLEYEIINKKRFQESFQIIVLIQARNESKHVPNVLVHFTEYCDGFIFLDDGSTDDTYVRASHEKLLVKTKKKYKGYFDDLENRNLLLRIASFFKSEWMIFIDADERMHFRYTNIREFTYNSNVDVYSLHLIDLWDYPETYRTDMLDRPSSGIATRKRMFRNKGAMQIHANREIHFPAVPYMRNPGLAKILILHYGNYDKAIRKRKYNLYTSQDLEEKKLGHSYDYLLDEKVKLKRVEDLRLDETIE
ncbi:MAG: hypothetical protein Mars2KO_20240 [Maribacter sp.]